MVDLGPFYSNRQGWLFHQKNLFPLEEWSNWIERLVVDQELFSDCTLESKRFVAKWYFRFHLGAVGTLLPNIAHASTTDKVLIVYWNGGGWDPTYIFDPHFESSALDRDPYSSNGTVGEIDFADSETRPSVRGFWNCMVSERPL